MSAIILDLGRNATGMVSISINEGDLPILE